QTASAYPCVVRVMARVNLAPVATAHANVGTDKDRFRERMKMARAVGLYGASVRSAHLTRCGVLETQARLDRVSDRDPDFNNFVLDKHIRLPLPEVEVANNPNLTTNNPHY